MDGRKRYAPPKGSNAHRGAAGITSSGSKRKGQGGRKKLIKVMHIGNPMRVTTSAEGFRALVQELTGRHADPSKYRGGGGGSPAIDVVDDYSSGGGLQAEKQPGALPSPGGSTEGSSDVIAGADQVTGFDDEESFMPQLIDSSYSVSSPPTYLYDTTTMS
jgi:hypothetical protein